MAGTFSLVLHAHMPYVKKHGKWPHGEEWLYEVMAETYIPLIRAINSLLNEGILPKITINVTPVLLEQLSDSYIKYSFEEYIKQKIEYAERDTKRFQRKKEYQKLAQFYVDYYERTLELYKTYNRDLPGEFKKLQDKGAIELIACPATHAYLPLLLHDEWIYFQIKIGIETYKKFFKRKPNGMWLPEMGYRPKGLWKGPLNITKNRAGLEEILEEFEIKYFFVDTHAIEGKRIRTLFSGIESQEDVSDTQSRVATTYKAYRVKGSSLSVIGRNPETSLQVWSKDIGYPGDPWYREFHKLDHISGLRYWRITDKSVPLDGKKIYNLQMALERVQVHAEHFVNLLRNLLKEKSEDSIVLSPYDAELFGHWWFEGIEWLEQIFRRLNEDDIVSLRTVSEYLEEYPPKEEITLPESSWGSGGKHMTWWNDKTLDYWKREYDAEIMSLDLKTWLKYKEDKKKYIIQALRELLLLQSSDWAFLITTEQATDYAVERYKKHYERLLKLYHAVLDNSEDVDENIFIEDSVFDSEIVEDAIFSI